MEIIVLRHWKEKDRASNTGRLVGNTLSPVKIIDYGVDDTDMLNFHENAVVLFPNIPEFPVPPCPSNITQIVVIDGTWTQVRKMLGRIPKIRHLPRLTVSELIPPYPRLRAPSVPNGLSTVEAVGSALQKLGFEDAERELRKANWLLLDALRKMTGIRHPLVSGLSFTDLRILDTK